MLNFLERDFGVSVDGDFRSNGGINVNVSPGSVVAGRYEIHERLGAGGVGMVFRASDRELEGEIVAVKLLHPHLAEDENTYRRFRNEVLVARSLSHPNIVRTHDIGRAEEGFLYISMEFVDGVSLKEHLTGRGGLPLTEALRILYQVVSGVAYAHGKGVIHRDLKPANIMISRSGDVKLADFGTARIVGGNTSLTQAGQVIGTPDYMSPEQIRGEELDHACDIYALGIVAYELVTAQRPFVADSSVAIAFKHLNDPVPSCISAEKGIPEWYNALVQQATAKARTGRFPSAIAMAGILLDHAPELSMQSSLLGMERSALVRTTGSHAVPEAVLSAEPRAPQIDLSDQTSRISSVDLRHGDIRNGDIRSGANGSASTVEPVPFGNESGTKRNGGREASGRSRLATGDHRGFELGESAGISTEDWNFGSPGSSRAPSGTVTRPNQSGANQLSKKFGIGAVSIIVVCLILPRINRDVGASVSAVVSVFDSSVPAISGLLRGIFGVEKNTMVSTSIIPSETPNSVIENPEIQKPKELASDTKKVEPASSNPTSDTVVASAPPEIDSEGKDAVKSASDADSTGKVTPVSAEENGTKLEAASEPEVAPKKEVPVPVKASATLAMIKAGKVTNSDSFAADELSSLRWNVTVNGLPSKGEGYTNEKAREEISVEIIELRSNKVLTRLRPDGIELAAKSSAATKLSGPLSSLRGLIRGAGSFSITVGYNGDVLSERDLVIYQSSVRAAEAYNTVPVNLGAGEAHNQATAGGQLVTIMPGQNGVTTVQPGSGAQMGSGTTPLPSNPTTPPIVENRPVDSRQVDTRMPTYGSRPVNQIPNGLPPAQGHEQSMALDTPPFTGTGTPFAGDGGAVVAPDPVPTVSERYSGAIVVVDGTTTTRRNLALSLSFAGKVISGTGTLEGTGEMRVKGQVLQRGLDIELSSDTSFLRLSCGLPGKSLRGRYSLPQEQRTGAWEATLSQ